MTTLTRLMLPAICLLAGMQPASATAAAPLLILDEEFNDVGALTGWTIKNASAPPGRAWFQGNPAVFDAHAGAGNAYIAANYLSAYRGEGSIDNWLITPELSLGGATTLSFFARAPQTPGFHDTLEVRFGSGGNFSTLLATLRTDLPLADSWQQFSASIDYQGSGQFAFRYAGNAATANYVGLDSLRVTSVPEPSAWLLLLAGVGLVGAARHIRHQRHS